MAKFNSTISPILIGISINPQITNIKFQFSISIPCIYSALPATSRYSYIIVFYQIYFKSRAIYSDLPKSSKIIQNIFKATKETPLQTAPVAVFLEKLSKLESGKIQFIGRLSLAL